LSPSSSTISDPQGPPFFHIEQGTPFSFRQALHPPSFFFPSLQQAVPAGAPIFFSNQAAYSLRHPPLLPPPPLPFLFPADVFCLTEKPLFFSGFYDQEWDPPPFFPSEAPPPSIFFGKKKSIPSQGQNTSFSPFLPLPKNPLVHNFSSPRLDGYYTFFFSKYANPLSSPLPPFVTSLIPCGLLHPLEFFSSG